MAAQRIAFSNNTPVFGWAFMGVWLAMLSVFTWLYVRDGGFPDTHPLFGLGFLALFWVSGIGCSSYCFRQPRIHLAVEGMEVVVRESLPWQSREERFSVKHLAPPKIVEEKDSDGDPYFFCRITTPKGRVVAFSEHHHLPTVEAARDRLMTAIGRPGAV